MLLYLVGYTNWSGRQSRSSSLEAASLLLSFDCWLAGLVELELGIGSMSCGGGGKSSGKTGDDGAESSDTAGRLSPKSLSRGGGGRSPELSKAAISGGRCGVSTLCGELMSAGGRGATDGVPGESGV